MRTLAPLILTLVGFSAHAASCPGSPAGVRAGATFQIYSGTTPQIYRICKGEPLRGGDCDLEIRNESNAVVALLEKQPMNSCACTDVEGRKIVVGAVAQGQTAVPASGPGSGAASGSACGGVSTTVWFSNVNRRE